jgi:hypothetical protein
MYLPLAGRSLLESLLGTLVLLILIPIAQAQVMTSSNYQIDSDSVNSGGGYSTSTNYQTESTAGEIATGYATSSSYQLQAGYQQNLETYSVSLTGALDVLLGPALGGITGGVASGSTAVVVVTDSPAGYQLTIAASLSPAMQKGADTIADYVPSGGVPDFLFTTGPTAVHFGYSPEGDDVAVRFQDNTTVCGVVGGDTSLRCWDGLSTSPVIIATAPIANSPFGATTTLQFRVGLGNTTNVASGDYVATTTLTAIAL